MAPGTAGTKKIVGEGRVTFIKSTHAFLAKPGLDGGIFVVPSSIMGQQAGYPDMHELLSRNDLVKFEAEPQEERNGIKWVATDGTVKVIGKAAEIQYKGVGTVTKVDERYGQFGFIESENGGIFFNANVVRPETADITKVLKRGQKVFFEAIQQKNQPQCKYRATMVHLKSYKPPQFAAQSAAAPSQARQQKPVANNRQTTTMPFGQTSAAVPQQKAFTTQQSGTGIVRGFQALSTGTGTGGSTDSSRASTPALGTPPPMGYVGAVGTPCVQNGTVAGYRSNSSSPFLASTQSAYPPSYGMQFAGRASAIPNNQPLDIIIQQSSNTAPKALPVFPQSSVEGSGSSQLRPHIFGSQTAASSSSYSGWMEPLFLSSEQGGSHGLFSFDQDVVGSRGPAGGLPWISAEDGNFQDYEAASLRLKFLAHNHAGIHDFKDCEICTPERE